MHSEEPLTQADKDLIEAHREELKDHITAHVQKILDHIEANCTRRPPIEKSHQLPRQIVLEDAMVGTSQPPLERIHQLPRQVAIEAAMEDLEEKSTRLLIELGRVEREINKNKAQLEHG